MEKHLMQPDTLLPVVTSGLSKSQLATMAEQSVDNVLETGQLFEVAEAIAAMEEFVKNIRKDERFVSFLRDELTKHHGRIYTGSGAKIELCESAVQYDYSQNGEWQMLEDQIRQLQAQKKEIEERLRRLSPGKVYVDPETGEVLEAPQKSSKSTYRITLSK
jgi:hypothetical protein